MWGPHLPLPLELKGRAGALSSALGGMGTSEAGCPPRVTHHAIGAVGAGAGGI